MNGTLRVVGSPEQIELDKRFYVPGVELESDCPECGETRRRSLARNYLSYPKTGVPQVEGFNCSNGHEWEARVVVRVVLEPAP